MLDFLNPIKGFGVTFHEMFRKVDTVQYPEVVQPTAPRFHGRHQLNRWPDGLEKCIGCELCAWAWDVTEANRAKRAEELDAAEAGAEADARAFPVPPLDLPHYHGLGLVQESIPTTTDSIGREVTGA